MIKLHKDPKKTHNTYIIIPQEDTRGFEDQQVKCPSEVKPKSLLLILERMTKEKNI